MRSALADQLQVWGLEGELVLFSDASLGFGLAATPIDVSTWNADRTNHLADRLAQFLNGLPEGLDLQFVQEIGRSGGTLLDQHIELGKSSSGSLSRGLCEERVEHFREYDNLGKLPSHGLQIWVRKLATSPLIKKVGLFSNPKLFQPMAEQALLTETRAAEQIRRDLTAELESLGLHCRPLIPDEVLDQIYRQWNPKRTVTLGVVDPDQVRSSLLFSDALIDEQGFSLGRMKHRVLSLKTMPDHTFASMVAILRELPFDSKVFLSIHVPNQLKELEALQTQRRLAFSMARGRTLGAPDLDSEAKLQDVETLLDQMISQGEKVFLVSFNILLRSPSNEELDRQCAHTLMLIRELSGAEAMEESVAAFPIFSEFALPNARAKERARRIKTSNLRDLLPIYGPWRGIGDPSVLLRSRLGSLIAFDPFSSELPNANQLVSGGSGSGKSFLTNLLVLQMLKEDPKVYIVDIGGSYRKICENLDGQYLPLGIDSPISLNPFDLAPGEEKPGPQKIKFLLGLIELMTKEDQETRIPRLDRAEIESAIQDVYQSTQNPRLSDLRQLLLKHPNEVIQRYGKILSSWCGDTAFGRFLDRQSTVNLEKDIVAFDLKGMAVYPDLQAVGIYILTDFVWRDVQKEWQRKKLFILDECWAQLKVQAGVDLIEETFRTMRKYQTSAIAISQDIGDFSSSAIAEAILPNCAIKWLLMQQQFDPNRLKDILGLNEKEIALVGTLHQEKGVYSEAYLLTQDKRGVVVIESTPLEYWIATTEPRDLAALERTLAENPTLSRSQALKHLSEKYPQGMTHASGVDDGGAA